MKNVLITLSLIAVVAFSSFAQTDSAAHTEVFQPGWYLVKSGAQVKVVQGNSDDVISKRDWKQISYSANEVLLVFNFAKDKYYCFDPEGRVVMIKGKASLEKIYTPGRPAHIIEDVKLNLDQTLVVGNIVWLTGFNASAKTANILLTNGQKAEIPQSSIQDLKKYLDSMDKWIEWHIVE
jgi:hypothetical protein